MDLCHETRQVTSDIRNEFIADSPLPGLSARGEDLLEDRIDGCHAFRICPGSDHRGDLFELLSLRDGGIEPIVHVYQVWAAPGSVRAWVYHARHTDRLCFTGGRFRVALCDLRPESRSFGSLVSFVAGSQNPLRLSIPPLVAHGVQNIGTERSAFVNLPTAVFCRHDPDKRRLPFDSPLIPFRW